MAEQWTVAFGRYLKMLRERRGLSLDDVASLSQTFADTIQKAWLSKCEHGQHRLAFSKAIPLCRIYHIPADVLVERLELDMELDRVGSPATEGLTFAELRSAGKEAMQHGRSWDAYAYMRDALCKAETDDLQEQYRDRAEQLCVAVINCSTAANALGRSRFALHELQEVHDLALLGPRFLPLLLDRLAVVCRKTGRPEEARGFGARALNAAEADGNRGFLGYVYQSRAIQAHLDGDLATAVDLYKKSFAALKSGDDSHGRANCLTNLAQAYADMTRTGAARRALLASQRLVERYGNDYVKARNHLLWGEMDAQEGRTVLAREHFEQAVQIARHLNHKVLRFKGEWQMLKLAMTDGNFAAARSISRRLRRLANYIPPSTVELAEFEAFEMTSSGRVS